MTNEPIDFNADAIPPKPKMPLAKVFLINLAIMTAYLGATFLMNQGSSEVGLAIMMIGFTMVLAQLGLNMLIGIILLFTQNYKELGKAMLLTGLLMGLIGFGACVGLITLSN